MVNEDLDRRGTLSDILRARFGEDVDLGLQLEPEAAGSESERLNDVIGRLQSHSPHESRYRLRREIARGGMGVIYKVWDEDLRRSLAKKVLLDDEGGAAPSTPATPPRTVGRFLEEAQITAQLDHPGVVPVHELGLDSEGRLYFTMRYIRGRDFRTQLSWVREGVQGWNLARALGVLLRVCETMAFAHDRKVIHRDLKPANVMVGNFGEVYVMDWGLARVIDGTEGRDLRPRGHPELSDSSMHTEFHGDADAPADSPLYTMDGDVIGTPAYMSPEQARGDTQLAGPSTDIYSVGAMLYQLLSGRMPYLPDARRISARAIWNLVLDGPPPRLRVLAADAPDELVAICEKAMARRIPGRYADMEELAEDLRAFLENRVVRAHRTGARVELRKWIERNRLAASALVAGVLVAVLGAGAIAVQSHLGELRALRLIDQLEIPRLIDRADSLWPIHPDRIPAMEIWLADAEEAFARVPGYRRLLAQRTAAEPLPEEPDPSILIVSHDFALADGLRQAEDVSSLEALLDEKKADLRRGGMELAKSVQWEADVDILVREVEHWGALRHRLLGRATSLTRRLAAERRGDPELDRLVTLVDVADGLLGVAQLHVESRLERARALRVETLERPQAAWDAAIASIADPAQCPLYDGLRIEPQEGLVPLRRNPAGLWEFWCWLSGVAPHQEDDSLRLVPESALVFILVPGGSFLMGADSSGPAADPLAGRNEMPAHPVDLRPYFLSKYELTQGQWRRLHEGAVNPSNYWVGSSFDDRLHPLPKRVSLLHPVEDVSYEDAVRGLARWNLGLPTEAQWELAARGGHRLPYGKTADSQALEGRVNFADSSLASVESQPDPGIDDGWFRHAPVDAMPADAWGFHHLLGNVKEWCQDWFVDDYDAPEIYAGSGQHDPGKLDKHWLHPSRGGSFRTALNQLRVSARTGSRSYDHFDDLGIRPALPLRKGSSP